MSDDDECIDEKPQPEDTMKILLATDIHLGYEQSTKRLQEADSFIAFEEILQHALRLEVDLLLLGGDLFHDSKPSQKVVLRCMELLKKYALGNRDLNISFLSNPHAVFPHSSEKAVNFEDPNMNIRLPIFSIHGNHDNPSFETTGSMDILGASGLINYFGKFPDLTNVTIPPLIFTKGQTKVSIYGLSYVNDQRLSRLLRDDQITLMQPPVIPDPFKILVLHQNRSKHTENGYIPEDKLPDFLDMVFWGHEHECRVDGEFVGDASTDPPKGYWITQPGSSVATSLCSAEAREKHVGLLNINKKHFRLEPIKLKTVRPFVFEDLHLRTVEFEINFAKPCSEIVCEHVDDYIEHILLPKAKKMLTDDRRQPKIPLIRLRIFYTKDEETFDVSGLARKYAEKVANPRDMIIFRKEKSVPGDCKKNVYHRDEEDVAGDISECFRTNDDDDWSQNIQGGIRNYFSRRDKKDNLKGLCVGGLNEALRSFVETGNDDAFTQIVSHQSKKMMEYLKNFDVDEEPDIIAQLAIYRDDRIKAEEIDDEEKEVRQFLIGETEKSGKKPTQSRARATRDDSDEEMSDHADDEDQPAARGRGRGSRGRGRGSRAGSTAAKATSRGRGKTTAIKTDLSSSIFGSAPKANSTVKHSTSSISAAFFGRTTTAKVTTPKKPQYIDDSDSD